VAKVLLAEDHLLSARTFGRVLSRCGLEIHHVTSGRDALHQLDITPKCDGFLLDIALEGPIDGLEVFDAVRAREPHAPCAIISGSTSSSVLNRVMRGRASFISKPCGRGELEVFARDALSSCITEYELREHVVALRIAIHLSPTEQAVFAWLVCGRSRASYCAEAKISTKTFERHVTSILFRAKKAGFESRDLGEMVATILRDARISRRSPS
jgi:DNA-binding NarL/FixJ family response regulator